MSNKIKKALPYIIVNLVGAALSVSSCFFESIAFIGFIGAILFLKFPFFPLIILITIFNIAAFIVIVGKVSDDNPYAGLIFAILYGSLGALGGTLFNRDYKFKKAVRIIFNAHIWLCALGYGSIYYIGSHF
ncbi:MAG: hypothetical protein K2H90_00585 [Oscillospiraceae bacterium]|nr:hypothetical protein [Oscillospiraceae bacterium]MDE7278719.1 hypothetical protein [Oscillospiraceae bacterium]